MVTVYRITAVWSGFNGAPGYTKFSFADLTDNTLRDAAGAKVRTLFDSLKSGLQTGWSVLVSPQIDEFDMATGALQGASTMPTAPTVVNGTAVAGPYAGGAGYCVTWNTSLIYARRRVRGRTFFVPAVSVYENDGTISPASVTIIRNAAQAFIALSAPRPNIWSRQYNAATPPVQVGGSLAPIDSYTFRDQTSQLRSRRL